MRAINVAANPVPDFGMLIEDSMETATRRCAKAVAVLAFVGVTAVGAATGVGAATAMGTGFAAGVLGGVAGAAIGGFLLTVPFAVVAQRTRQFNGADAIMSPLRYLLTITRASKKALLIENILKMSANRSFWGMRSDGSANLVSALLNDDRDIEERWGLLFAYMHRRSGEGAYFHDGKKLFNTILKVIENDRRPRNHVAVADDVSLLEQLKKIFTEVTDSKWDQSGVGFLKRKAPDGITKLRECFAQALKNTSSLDQLSAPDRRGLAKKLMDIVAKKRNSYSGRREAAVEKFYMEFPDLDGRFPAVPVPAAVTVPATAPATFTQRLEAIGFEGDVSEKYIDTISLEIMNAPVRVPCVVEHTEIRERFYDKTTVEGIKKSIEDKLRDTSWTEKKAVDYYKEHYVDPLDRTSPLPSPIVVDQALLQEIEAFVASKEEEHKKAFAEEQHDEVSKSVSP